MTVLVLGHLVRDEIHTANGEVIESLGGIYFSLSAFAALADSDDEILPVFPVGHDAWEEFTEAFRKRRHVRMNACWRVPKPNTRVRLFHESTASYNTQLVSSLDSIPYHAIQPHLTQAGLLYINMMTGDDILLHDAMKLRGQTDGLIYLDLHMLAYRVHEDGRRSGARLSDWREWLSFPDVLQCNEREFSMLGEKGGNEADRASFLLESTAVNMIIVTKGESGATLHRTGEQLVDIPAVIVPAPVDPTGCGDVFGTTAAYLLASGMEPVEAFTIASKAAAFVVTIPGSHGLEKLGSVLRREAG